MIFEEKTLKRDVKYQGKILNLVVEEVTAPSGTAMREIVEHRGAVAMIPVKDDGKVVLVRQYRRTAEKAMLEIPAGKLESGENVDPMAAARRELREETGYSAGNIEFLFSYLPCIGYSTERIYVYLCKDLVPGETEFDDDEAIETEEVTVEQMIEMVENGQIQDGKTIIAAYYLRK